MWKNSTASVVSLSGAVFGTLIYLGNISSEVMRESPITASSYLRRDDYQVGIQKQLVSQLNYNEYIELGIVVIDNVLTTQELNSARLEVDDMLKGKNHFAQNAHDDESVRTDLVAWISESIGDGQKSIIGEAMKRVLRIVRSVPRELELFGKDAKILGVPFTSQLACYDGGNSHYIPHRDSSEPSEHPLAWLLQSELKAREITIILYLNDEIWDSSDGGLIDSGHLKAYLGCHCHDMTGETAKKVISIAPKGGRMVIMNSKQVLHEVCPSAQRRVALTCWIGGLHSHSEYLRPLCIPFKEINWKFYLSGWV